MATEKVTLSLDGVAASLARSAAAREGMTLSAWLSRAARREAVRAGAGPARVADVRFDAQLDEQERGAAARYLRETG